MSEREASDDEVFAYAQEHGRGLGAHTLGRLGKMGVTWHEPSQQWLRPGSPTLPAAAQNSQTRASPGRAAVTDHEAKRADSLAQVANLNNRLDKAWLDVGSLYAGETILLTSMERDALKQVEAQLAQAREVLAHAFVPYAGPKR